MRTLIIDNYDSFTYNLFQYIAEMNGEPPLVVSNDQYSWQEIQLLQYDNIVISPGPGRPDVYADFGVCKDVILQGRAPVLGVCLGHQGIAHYFGGRVVPAPVAMHGRISAVWHDGEGLFRTIPSPFNVVRYHSLMAEGVLPSGLRTTARTSDGVIMGLQHCSRPIWGVQFHPESICTEHGTQILRNFRDITHESLEPSRRNYFFPAASSTFPKPTKEAESRFQIKWRKFDRLVKPEQAFIALFQDSPTAFWLDSAMQNHPASRFSFMGSADGPHAATLKYRRNPQSLEIKTGAILRQEDRPLLEYLADFLASTACDKSGLPFDFSGGFVGYLGYELKGDLGAATGMFSKEPDACLIFSDRFLAFDLHEEKIYMVALEQGPLSKSQDWFDDIEAKLRGMALSNPKAFDASDAKPIAFELLHSKEKYLEMISEAQRQIRLGETYEVCLTNKLLATSQIDGIRTYLQLRERNPAPFAAFLRFDDLCILSSSPERFISVDSSRCVTAKPIKGTTKRGKDVESDATLRSALALDEKSRSEHLMIVDLLRNDLGRVCEPTSISVPKFMDVESFSTVHQLVSTIHGKLAVEQNIISLIEAAFPGGSMTGAPKIRTMEIIEGLEQNARGIYSGAIGYIGLNGILDLSIVIRTIVANGPHLSIGVGGAIVALSEPDAEFDETILKAEALLRVLKGTL